jgi:hypothetical protein
VDTVIKILTIPAGSAYFYNDVLGLISLLGGLVWFLGTFPNSPFKRLIGLAEWSSAPLVFGTFFQISFLVIGMAPETPRMGILVPLAPGLVTALFAISLVLLIGRVWVKRRYGLQ